MRRLLLAIGLFTISHLPTHAADGIWLDQYNALFYLGTFRLDAELKAMRTTGAKTLLLHADSIPSPILEFIAWRASKTAGIDTVAWIQKPNRSNLLRAAELTGIKAVQIDDHYFNKPPMPISELRQQLDGKDLWCSFQPRQYNTAIASQCDQADVQIYRQTCSDTIATALRLGILGKPHIAIATYADGSQQGETLVRCLEQKLKRTGNPLFVFKWSNQEVKIRQLWRVLQPQG